MERKTLDFIIIGAARSGTTALSEYLKKYKDIYMPNFQGEPNFFYKDSEYLKGIDYYLYKYFSNIDNKKVVGEKSTSYLYGGSKVAKRIYDFQNDVKLIILIRNPIERAYSNYKFTVKNNIEILNFKYAIEHEKERNENYVGKWKEIKPFDYTGRSLYYQQIKEYLGVFDKKQILIVVYEELINKPYYYLRDICDFINIDFLKDIEFKKINATNQDDDIDEYTYNLLYEKVIKDIDKLSILINKDLFKIWKLNEKKV